MVVAGGGLAGVAAALTAADAGAAVTLVEARPRLGGATYSFDRNGLVVDNGQHVFLRCCTAYRGFLDRLGVTGQTALQDRLSLPVLRPGRRPAVLRRTAGLPAPLHLGPSLARYAALSPADRLRAVPAVLALRRLDPTDPALDRQTFGAWLTRHWQRDAAVHALWDLICVATLNAPAEDASLALAAMVFRTGLLDDASGGDIGISRVPLGDLHDHPSRRALAAVGATVRLGCRVSEILVEDGRAAGVRADGGTIPADVVVLAVPHDAAAALLPTGATPDPGRIAALGAAPIVNVHVRYDRGVLEVPFAAGLGTPVQWVFDRSAAAGAGTGQYVVVSLSAADRWVRTRTRDLREVFLPALAALLPAARAARVEDFFVTREPRATFRAGPGSGRLRPPARTAIPGLWLAGAYTDTSWPATMEGAVRSGVTAARQLLGSPWDTPTPSRAAA